MKMRERGKGSERARKMDRGRAMEGGAEGWRAVCMYTSCLIVLVVIYCTFTQVSPLVHHPDTYLTRKESHSNKHCSIDRLPGCMFLPIHYSKLMA